MEGVSQSYRADEPAFRHYSPASTNGRPASARLIKEKLTTLRASLGDLSFSGRDEGEGQAAVGFFVAL